MEYYWIEVLFGILAIMAFAYGEWQDRIEAGRHATDCKIYRRRVRNEMIRHKMYDINNMGYKK